jgi:hypothetical protein
MWAAALRPAKKKIFSQAKKIFGRSVFSDARLFPAPRLFWRAAFAWSQGRTLSGAPKVRAGAKAKEFAERRLNATDNRAFGRRQRGAALGPREGALGRLSGARKVRAGPKRKELLAKLLRAAAGAFPRRPGKRRENSRLSRPCAKAF